MPTVNEIVNRYYGEDIRTVLLRRWEEHRKMLFLSVEQFLLRYTDYCLERPYLARDEKATSRIWCGLSFQIKVKIATAIYCHLLETDQNAVITALVQHSTEMLSYVCVPINWKSHPKYPLLLHDKFYRAEPISATDVKDLIDGGKSQNLWFSCFRSNQHDEQLHLLQSGLGDDNRYQVINFIYREVFSYLRWRTANEDGRFMETVRAGLAMARHIPVNHELFRPYHVVVKSKARKCLGFFNRNVQDIICNYYNSPANHFDYYYSIPKSIREQRTAEYDKQFPELDNATIVNTAELLLTSLGISKNKFHHFCVISPDAERFLGREEKKEHSELSFAAQFAAELKVNPQEMRKHFVFTTIPTRGEGVAGHAVMVVFNNIKKQIICIDPKMGGGLVKVLGYLREAVTKINFLKDYAILHPPDRAPYKQQTPDQKFACGFYVTLNIIGVIIGMIGFDRSVVIRSNVKELLQDISINISTWGGVTPYNKKHIQTLKGVIAHLQAMNVDREKIDLRSNLALVL